MEVHCLAGCLTWLSSKSLLSFYLENSSSWSWEREECLLPHREGQRNTETQRPAKGQIQFFLIAWATGGESEGMWQEAAVAGVLIQRDRCPEEAAVRHNQKTFWTGRQGLCPPSVPGAKTFFRAFSCLLQFIVLMKNNEFFNVCEMI